MEHALCNCSLVVQSCCWRAGGLLLQRRCRWWLCCCECTAVQLLLLAVLMAAACVVGCVFVLLGTPCVAASCNIKLRRQVILVSQMLPVDVRLICVAGSYADSSQDSLSSASSGLVVAHDNTALACLAACLSLAVLQLRV